MARGKQESEEANRAVIPSVSEGSAQRRQDSSLALGMTFFSRPAVPPLLDRNNEDLNLRYASSAKWSCS
jgi:hypothetical protein